MTTLFSLALCASTSLVHVEPANIMLGDSTDMGNGKLTSWARLSPQGKPEQIGITLTAGALENLPLAEFNSFSKTFDVSIPKAFRGLPFDHVAVDYATMGHDPMPVYGFPHFDIHFYMCSRTDRTKMLIKGPGDLKLFDKPVPPGYTPADYVLVPGTEIPTMGAHWVDLGTPELHGKSFTSSIIYGSYNGKVNFIEPMVTEAFLQNKPNFSGKVKTPKMVSKTGYYPGEYCVAYMPKENEYRIWFDKFVYLKAAN